MKKTPRLEVLVLDLSAAGNAGSSIASFLESAHYLPRLAAHPAEALIHLRAGGSDAMVVISDPGDEVTEALVGDAWALTSKPLIVALTRSDPAYALGLMERGARDFLCGSVCAERDLDLVLRELGARMTASLRQHHLGQVARAPLVLGDVVIDADARTVHQAGRPIDLSRTEYRLLLALGAAAGQIVAHRDLLRSVWSSHQDHRVEYLRTYVHRLRRRLRWQSPAGPRIVAVRRRGYRLDLPAPAEAC